jgi:hypothetical protein
MATDDNSLRERVRPKSTLLDDISRAAARGARPDGDDEEPAPDGDAIIPLPQPGSPYDAAHARPESKPLPTLRFVMGDTVRGLPYANLDSIDLVPADQPGGGPVIVIRFNGIVAREVKITGRHLFKLYDLLTAHRVSWVRALPKGKDFMGDGVTVVTGIVIERIKEVPA